MWAGQMLQITSQLEHMGVARRIMARGFEMPGTSLCPWAQPPGISLQGPPSSKFHPPPKGQPGERNSQQLGGRA